MKVAEIGAFLNPFGETLSTIFVVSLITLTIATVVWLLISAKEANWEANWYGGDLNDDTNNLAGEHGSVHELSQAIATKAEKVAEIMPSMLLIVGLLGTFLGLGIALNKASTVLAMADTAGMDSAMTQLMGLMDGLGAKFKTSTWGILCFIILNLLFNIFGFQEKRLVWAVKKVREEAQAKEMVLNSKELERHQVMIETLKSIDNNAQQHSQILVDSIMSLQKESAKELNNSFLIFGQIRNDINNNNRNLVDSFNKAHEHSLSKYEALFGQVQSSLNNNNKIATKNAKDNITELQEIASYNKATQKSMQDFVEQTVESMASIGKSADKMAVAATAVGSSAEGLNGVVKNLRDELEGVMSMIKQDLSDTINNMGDNFESNMATMSKNMSKATLGISKAVDELSTSVDKTMTDVTGIIGESMDLQRKSANEFTVTSEALNSQVFEMTDLVKQLSGDITSGLKAVSESGRRMKSLDSRYEKYSELIEKITDTNIQLLNDNQHITSYLPRIIDSIPNLSDNINDTFLESVKIQRNSTDIFDQLSSDIKNALTVISHSADRLEVLNSRYENYSILVESITQSNQKLIAKIDEKTMA
ncbi:conserved hypothetical protein [Psychrobacter arcticus 273-4]|uniref:MotA/TolQ/ExbB proton channel domain-containing protein n=1 Tax=Psychrobacter arcticus (strain DSM 17307 / VKM B-2377 / 273-4) TaxID=259536 RepID=Q4FTD4_PSYA2|nr:hypothetical protein [Psychrobacter arcticus]AAZ18724.1 conserved hypothetical protein [Psychrobacter arcticus 273-4]